MEVELIHNGIPLFVDVFSCLTFLFDPILLHFSSISSNFIRFSSSSINHLSLLPSTYEIPLTNVSIVFSMCLSLLVPLESSLDRWNNHLLQFVASLFIFTKCARENPYMIKLLFMFKQHLRM